MKNLIPLRSNPNDYSTFDSIYTYMLMGEQDFIIMSSKNQQAFDSKLTKSQKRRNILGDKGCIITKLI